MCFFKKRKKAVQKVDNYENIGKNQSELKLILSIVENTHKPFINQVKELLDEVTYFDKTEDGHVNAIDLEINKMLIEFKKYLELNYNNSNLNEIQKFIFDLKNIIVSRKAESKRFKVKKVK